MAEHLLDREDKVIRQLEQQYKLALQDVEMTIRIMQADEQTPSRIHRIEYQERVKAQLEGVLEALHRNEYKTINKFLQDSYTDAFVGTMYDMHRQGVPMIVPMDQNAAIKAIQLDTKLSDRKIHPNANGEHVTLYESLGVDTDDLKETIRKEITRGLASNMLPEDIARNISYLTKAPLSRAKTIARTESHRIQQASAQDARERAKARGAKVYKQWDSTLDGATRKAHKALDGQIVEIDKPFVYGTHKAMYPGDFGDPALDCNCRCVAVQRAAWALTEEELEEQKRRAETFGLGQDEGKKLQFQEFEKRFLKAAETVDNPLESVIIDIDEMTPCLRRISDGKIVNTTVFDISPTRKEFKDWEFDWTKPERSGFSVRAIKADGDERIQGMLAWKPDPKNFAVLVDVVESAPFNNPHNKLYTGKEYAGVGGHLFAEAVKQSYKHGYGGFVYFKAKTNLIEHYERELGAVLIHPRERIMAIDERAAKRLYERYYQQEE